MSLPPQTLASGSPRAREVLEQAQKQFGFIPNMYARMEFTRTLVATRGWLDRAEVDAFLAAGYTERHILEIILAVGVKTLSNWSNHVFNTPVDDMFAARQWSTAPATASAA